ncbi:hypothetical protein [Caenispirillum bisanense]|uniref:hypothetical protein n=1 Tax=Caenispirillum bisanense TaxID=414052 RepID=UPI0031D553F4
MGALYAVSGLPLDRLTAAAERLEDGLRRQGFAAPLRLAGSAGIIGVCPPLAGGGGPLVYECASAPDGTEGGAIVAAGTLFYRGACGSAALPALLRDIAAGTVAEALLWGCFAVAALVRGRLVVFSDRTGTFHLYAADGGRLVSSSFLALAEGLPRRSVDVTAAWDYVFHGAPHGGITPLREISLLGPASRTTTDRDGRQFTESRPCPLPEPNGGETLEQSAERCLAILDDRFADIVRGFPDRADTALSGGYDSRLILALLRRHGSTPGLHVYGRADSDDVRVARAICAGEKLALDHTDKSALPLPEPAAQAEIVRRNLFAFDGYPCDGIFDSGADLATRSARCAGGRLALNGGGGEVFRNFFYLSDRALTADEMRRVFWRQYDPATAGASFDEAVYGRSFARRIADTFGTAPDQPLDRQRIEALYPYFRCRWWMGHNTSVNARLGHGLTPFADPEVVGAALASPRPHKNFGRLQAMIIRLADPALAAYGSAYGHAFDRRPPLARMVRESLTYVRPPWLRARGYGLRRRPQPLPALLAPGRVGAVFGSGLSYAGRLMRLEALHDAAQLNRALTLEALYRHLNADWA